MEFLEENNCAHLFSLINIEMNPPEEKEPASASETEESGKLPETQTGFVPMT